MRPCCVYAPGQGIMQTHWCAIVGQCVDPDVLQIHFEDKLMNQSIAT